MSTVLMQLRLTPGIIMGLIVGYFALLMLISFLTSKKGDNDTFFIGDRKSHWFLVAFGMIGASLSGVTFISVPGWVAERQFSYMQMVLGFLAGYAVIATVLLPLYYRLRLTSIYTYLGDRFGYWSHKTGAFFFLLSRVIGASFRLFLVAIILQTFVFDAFNVPFAVTVAVTIVLIWIYTFRGGIRTIVWTDTLQTLFMLAALGLSIYFIVQGLGFDGDDMVDAIRDSDYSRIFFFDEGWSEKKFFFKSFLGGMFIAIVMTGLDQDMMQKNISCPNIRDAQKNVLAFCGILLVVNFVFLCLGALLYMYASETGMQIPERSDLLFPEIAVNQLPLAAGIVFILGLIAAAYSSADSALTALTTSFCVDFLGFKEKDINVQEPLGTEALSHADEEQKRQKQTRTWVHVGFSVLLLIVIIIFREINDQSVISAVYTVAGYTYGPLLGLFAFGVMTKRKVRDAWVPLVCFLSPVICYIVNANSAKWLNGYVFDFELLILNGLLTFIGLWLLSIGASKTNKARNETLA